MTVTHTFTTTAIPTSLRVAVPAPIGTGAAAPRSEVLLTIKDVAAACKLSETAVRRAITDGELPAVKLRSRMRITPEDFNAWIAAPRQSQGRAATPPRPTRRPARSAPAGSFRALAQAGMTREQADVVRAQAR